MISGFIPAAGVHRTIMSSSSASLLQGFRALRVPGLAEPENFGSLEPKSTSNTLTLSSTCTPTVCSNVAFWAVLKCLGLVFLLLVGFRQTLNPPYLAHPYSSQGQYGLLNGPQWPLIVLRVSGLGFTKRP